MIDQTLSTIRPVMQFENVLGKFYNLLTLTTRCFDDRMDEIYDEFVNP